MHSFVARLLLNCSCDTYGKMCSYQFSRHNLAHIHQIIYEAILFPVDAVYLPGELILAPALVLLVYCLLHLTRHNSLDTLAEYCKHQLTAPIPPELSPLRLYLSLKVLYDLLDELPALWRFLVLEATLVGHFLAAQQTMHALLFV